MRKTCIQIVFAVNYMYIYIYLSFHRKSMKTDTERQRASQRILSDREKKRDRERERERETQRRRGLVESGMQPLVELSLCECARPHILVSGRRHAELRSAWLVGTRGRSGLLLRQVHAVLRCCKLLCRRGRLAGPNGSCPRSN